MAKKTFIGMHDLCVPATIFRCARATFHPLRVSPLGAQNFCRKSCIRRNGDFLRAAGHDELAARIQVVHNDARKMAALVRQAAWVTPHAGQSGSFMTPFGRGRRRNGILSRPHEFVTCGPRPTEYCSARRRLSRDGRRFCSRDFALPRSTSHCPLALRSPHSDQNLLSRILNPSAALINPRAGRP